jgi:hypothetical protein
MPVDSVEIDPRQSDGGQLATSDPGRLVTNGREDDVLIIGRQRRCDPWYVHPGLA